MIARLTDVSAPRLGTRLMPGLTWRLPSAAGRCLALTFDDGPSPGATDRVLDILAESEAHATFFILSETALRHRDIVNRILHAGHDIGLHGFDHRDPWRTRPSQLSDMLDRAMDELTECIGMRPIGFRPPFGHITPGLVAWAKDQQLPIVMWDILAGDFRRTASPASIAARVARYARPGSILVLHDNESSGHLAADSLPRIITEVSRLDLSTTTLSNLLT